MSDVCYVVYIVKVNAAQTQAGTWGDSSLVLQDCLRATYNGRNTGTESRRADPGSLNSWQAGMNSPPGPD